MTPLLLLAASLAAAAAPPDDLKAVDAELDRAEAYVTALEAAVQGRDAGAACPSPLTVRGLADDLRGKRLAETMGGDLPEENGAKRDWQVYHVCRALAASDPAPCAQADAIAAKNVPANGGARPGSSYRANCEMAYEQSRAAAALLRGDPKFPEICRDALPRLSEFKSPAAVDAVCRAWREDRGGGHEALIAAIAAGLAKPPAAEAVRGVAGELTADPASCASLGEDYQAAVCRELDDLRRAASKGASACSGGICRALMGGGPAACDAYSATFLRAACDKTYGARFTADSEAGFAVHADKAGKSLDLLDAAAKGAAELEATGARFDRLYALKARMRKAALAYSPPAPGAKRKP